MGGNGGKLYVGGVAVQKVYLGEQCVYELISEGGGTVTLTLNVTNYNYVTSYSVYSSSSSYTGSYMSSSSLTFTFNVGETVRWSFYGSNGREATGSVTMLANTVRELTLAAYYSLYISTNPSNAIPTISGVTTNYLGNIPSGATVPWKVECSGYTTQSGTWTATTDSSMTITLASAVTPTTTYDVNFYIKPISGGDGSDLVLKLYDSNVSFITSSLTGTISGSYMSYTYTVESGETIYYDINAVGYKTNGGIIRNISSDTAVTHNLTLESYTFAISATPSDATVKINGTTGFSASCTYNSSMSWEVYKTGYVEKSGTTTVTGDTLLHVSLNAEGSSWIEISANTSPIPASQANAYFNLDYGYLNTAVPLTFSVTGNLSTPSSYSLSTSAGTDTIIVPITANSTTSQVESTITVTGEDIYGNTVTAQTSIIQAIPVATITFDVTPSDSTIHYATGTTASFTPSWQTLSGNEVQVEVGKYLWYAVGHSGYIGQSAYYYVEGDDTITVALVDEGYTYNVTTTQAGVNINVYDLYGGTGLIYQSAATVGNYTHVITSSTVSAVTWSASLNNYVSQNGYLYATGTTATTVTLSPASSNYYTANIETIPVSASVCTITWYSDSSRTNVIGSGPSLTRSENTTAYYKITHGDFATYTGGYTFTGDTTIEIELTVSSPQDIPLTFAIRSDGYINWRKFSAAEEKTISYSINDGSLQTITSTANGIHITVSAGDIVRFYGDNSAYAISINYYNGFIGSTAEFMLYGNILSLIDSSNFDRLYTVGDFAFVKMFYNCKTLLWAKGMVLPATTLGRHCYRELFRDSINLTAGPELRALTLTEGCYYRMFSACSSLTYAYALFTTTPSSTYTNNWLYGVASSGTIYINPNATWDSSISRSASTVPSGWTIIDAT